MGQSVDARRRAQADLGDWDAFIARAAQAEGASIAQAREYLDAGRKRIEQAFRAGAHVDVLVEARSALVDAVLGSAWRALADSANACLVAVGGYGRGELLPHSDIDVLILYRQGTLDDVGPALERFLTHLWDIGLEVGHSVRSPAECAEQAEADITIMTNLMESRALAGDPDALLRLSAAGRAHIEDKFRASLGAEVLVEEIRRLSKKDS